MSKGTREIGEQEITQMNVRLPKKSREQFVAMAEDAGMTQVEFLQLLIKNAEVDGLKAAVPEAASDIDAYMAHLGALEQAYRAAVQRSADAYSIAASRVRQELDTLAGLVADNHRLQNEAARHNEEMARDQAEIVRLTKELQLVNAAKTELESVSAENYQLRDQITNLREELVKNREVHAAELDELKRSFEASMHAVRDDQFAQILEIIKAQGK